MTIACLLHDLGAEEAGASWRAVLPDGWVAPDLPGHGSAAAPRHGAYDPLGPTTLARWTLAGAGLVIGVGQNAHGALILGAGGGCDAVAVVDGLWGPWTTEAQSVDAMYGNLRRLLEDRGATDPPPPSGRDPRTTHGYGVTMSRAFAQRFWGAIPCAVVAVETPASPTATEERADRLGWFGGPTTLVELDTRDPGAIIDAIRGWNAQR